jgi:glutamate 5-kinase
MSSGFRRVAVKVGSNVITGEDGSPDTGRILRIVEDIAVMFRSGTDVVLISSGAVAAGRKGIKLSKSTTLVSSRQVLSAIGQVKLMASYQFLFSKYLIDAGQVLTTKESFRDRRHYLNMKNCITAMLENRILPIINENDTVSVNELMFTDNDELSELIASMMNCDALIILSNVDGLFTGVPGCEGAELIREVDNESHDVNKFISPSKSGSGRGGMVTKCTVARKIASEGIDVYLANGRRDSIIRDIVNHKNVPCTHFIPQENKANNVKKWLSHSETFAKGVVYVNQGAREALLSGKATSLLMIGITGIEGSFRKGDIVSICDEKGAKIGLGKSQFDSGKAEQHIGKKISRPLIHYDFLVVTDKQEPELKNV